MADQTALIAELRSTIQAHRDQMAHMISATFLAEMMTANSDSDGQWDGSDICEALGQAIKLAHGWSDEECPDHGSWPASMTACPFHDDEEDDG